MATLYQQNLIQLARNQKFELPKFYLRPITIADLVDYHELTANDDALKYDYPAHQNLEESLSMMVKWHLSQPLGKYGIILKSENKLVGNVSLSISEDSGICRIGYAVSPNYQRRGIAFDCVGFLSSYALTQLQIERLQGDVHEENRGSVALLEKLGFEKITEETASSLRYESFNQLNYAKYS